MTLRVLYSFPHPLGSPGIGTTALEQVRGLVRRGAEVTLWCASVAGSFADLPEELHRTLVVGGRRIPHRMLGGDRSYHYHDRRVASALLRSRRDFDVVHGWPVGSAATFAAARRRGLPRLRESPNTYTASAYQCIADEALRLGLPLSTASSHRPNPERLAREELEYEWSSAILAPSGVVADSYAQRPGGPLRVLRHQYGFDPDRFPAPELGETSDHPFTMAFVGSCEPRKGVHHALAAWVASGVGERGGRFLILGRWDPTYRAYLQRELDNAVGVELVGFSDDVGSVLRRADALVHASVEEGSALVTYEAQASGCALLVSTASGALMTDGVHGRLHRPGDEAALARQIAELAGDTRLLQRMQRAVLDHRDSLTWDAAAECLERCYRAAMAGG